MEQLKLLLHEYAALIARFDTAWYREDDLAELDAPRKSSSPHRLSRKVVSFFDGATPEPMFSECCREEAVPTAAGSMFTLPVDDSEKEQRLHDEVMTILRALNVLRDAGAMDMLCAKLDDETLAALRYMRRQPSRLLIDRRRRILLPDYNKEIEMPPLSKALYLLFLAHPEGIRLKCMSDYQIELTRLYLEVTNRGDRDHAIAAVESLCYPGADVLKTTFSRMNQAFRKALQADVAEYYTVRGANGEPRRIELPGELITIS